MKIENKDFRIGNLVYDSLREYNKVISKSNFMNLDYSIELNIIEPIPLNEEWLLRFGAEVSKSYANQYRIKDRLFVIREGKIVDYGSSVVLEYIHQLQNFFFALTNTELNYENRG